MASYNPDWIIWKDKDNGDVCGAPNLPFNYTRPDDVDMSCIWSPVNTGVIGGIDYNSLTFYMSTLFSFISVAMLLLLAPLADFTHYKKWLVFIFGYSNCACILLIYFFKDNKYYLINSIVSNIATLTSGLT